MATKKSMIDVAYDLMASKKRAVPFAKLWADVSKTLKLSNDQIGQFYNDLSQDNRFLALNDNKWDLKERRKFSEGHVKVEEIEDEEEELTDEEKEEAPIQIDEY